MTYKNMGFIPSKYMTVNIKRRIYIPIKLGEGSSRRRRNINGFLAGKNVLLQMYETMLLT
jgi:hypothetical protein